MEIRKISQKEHCGAAYPAGLQRIDYESSVDGKADWALALPPSEGKTWVVCIHGHGSHGDQIYLRQDVRNWYLPQYFKRGYGILTPNLRDNSWMSPASVEDLDGLLDYLRERYGEERFLFAGGSMGGTANLIYACQRPCNVAGVVALGAATDLVSYLAFCRGNQAQTPVLKDIADAIEASFGGGPEQCAELYRSFSPLYNTEALRGIPVFYAHGTCDALMPIADARRFAGAMFDQTMFAYMEMAGGGHDSPLPLGCTEATASFQPLDWIDRKDRQAR